VSHSHSKREKTREDPTKLCLYSPHPRFGGNRERADKIVIVVQIHIRLLKFCLLLKEPGKFVEEKRILKVWGHNVKGC
jgi:hypothetical protein